MALEDIEIQKRFFHPVCNRDEIERIFNCQNAGDHLLKLKAETIVDHMRLFRVYRNKALINEKKWALEKSFSIRHYSEFIKHLDKDDAAICKSITAGNIFSTKPNGKIFVTDYGPIITICDSLSFFFKFMNLALMDFNGRVPEYVCVNALRIAIRVMLQREALDFFMDPRGIVPHDIGIAIHSTIPEQMLFIAGHEYSHYLLEHVSKATISDDAIFNAIFPGDEEYKPIKIYNYLQQHEFDADEKSLFLPKYSNKKRVKVIEAALAWFGSLYLYENVIDAISPPNPYAFHTHPPAIDRYNSILSLSSKIKNFDANKWKRFVGTLDYYKDILLEDVSLNIHCYEFYGSVYLDKPDSEWRGKELKDRIDYY
jgi:hypothetical protein